MAAERARVFRSDPGEYPGLVVRDVRKRYPGVATDAVRGVSFGVSPGEIFGLLGVNGAGKTTTFKMLSGELAPSSGAAFLTPRRGDAIRVGGVDALAREKTRGVLSTIRRPARDDDRAGTPRVLRRASRVRARGRRAVGGARGVARGVARRVGRTIAANLSGGQRRKLSVAVALVGDPAVVLLDEPSTGMDPESRRGLWRALAAAAAEGRAMVLTTHSTEEADALCRASPSREKARFDASGRPRDSRRRTARDTRWYVRVSEEGDDAARAARRDGARAFVRREMPGARGGDAEDDFDDEYDFVDDRFRLAAGASVARAFAAMEARDETLGIVEYQLGQTTLEEVFLRVAEEGETDEERA